MFAKLESLERKFLDLEQELADPTVFNDQDRYRKLTKAHSDLKPVVDIFRQYRELKQNLVDNQELLNDADPDIREMAHEEIKSIEEKLPELEHDLKVLLLPTDPLDEKNIILEIRAGTGGEEAALFGGDLFRMYCRYAETMRWKTEIIDCSETELGGMKEVVFSVAGKGVYSKLKYESGVHRVQRVPETESQGRVHTSTVTVAVLPEAEDVEVEINEKDLKIDTYRSGGAGGQHINKTESCIRITHLPTGIVVTCQDERSQIKNREKAMKVLKSRLYDYYNTKYRSDYAENRKSQIGTGDRSERIRTYNFPQNRVTDHRIGLTLYSLDTFIMGDIGAMLEGLAIADREAQLGSQDLG